MFYTDRRAIVFNVAITQSKLDLQQEQTAKQAGSNDFIQEISLEISSLIKPNENVQDLVSQFRCTLAFYESS